MRIQLLVRPSVVRDEGAVERLVAEAEALGFRPRRDRRRSWRHGVVHGEVDEEDVVEAIRALPDVESVELERRYQI